MSNENDAQATRELIKDWYKSQDVKKLIAYFFNQEKKKDDWVLPTKGQEDIVKGLLYNRKSRRLIPAHTRYGKSQWVAIGIVLKLLFSKNRKVIIIAPTNDKTKIIRDYIVKAIMDCALARSILDIDVDKDERLKKEVSKQRMTFKNGCVIQTLSAEGNGQRLMGWGLGSEGGDLVVDELAEIKRDVVNTKIMRMLGDSPENSSFTGLYNSWSKDSAAYDMEMSGDYDVLHIDYKQGIEEGRISQEFIDHQRKILNKTQFQVLYEARFPDETDDALIPYTDLLKAKEEIDLNENHEYLLGCDIAAFGIDFTVLTVVKHYLESDLFKIEEIQEFRKQDTMKTTGNIISLINRYEPSRVNIDGTGLGQGVYDRLIEQDYNVNDVKVGRAAISNQKLYLNQKSEMYDNLRKLFESSKIRNLTNQKLMSELSIMTTEINSSGKLKIIDPEKSPDYADSFALCLYDLCSADFSTIDNIDFLF